MTTGKKILAIGGFFVLLLFVGLIISVISSYKKLEQKAYDLRYQFRRSFIQNEMEFLAEIEQESKARSGLGNMTTKIDQRVSFLKDTLNGYSNAKRSSDLNDERKEWGLRSEEISFLLALAQDCNSAHARVLEKRINEKIAGLRTTLVINLAISNLGSVKTDISSLSKWFYLPSTAMQPIINQWSEGGGAIIYTVKGSFPFDRLVKDISNYYSDLELEPLDYDLCQPNRLGAIKHGWYEDRLWSQFWITPSKDHVINANITEFSEPPFEQTKGAIVVILRNSANRLRDALNYYNVIHNGAKGKTENTTRESKFFLFRPFSIEESK